MITRALGIGLIVSTLIPGCTSFDSGQMSMDTSESVPGIQGAWRISEMNTAEGTSVADPASVYLFGSTYYTIMYASADAPRATFADPNTPTDAEIAGAYANFIANAGTYSVVADTLVIRPVISKHPNYMGGGFDTFVFRVAGDTLWLNNVPGAFRFAGGQSPAVTGAAGDAFKLIRLR